MRGYAAAPKVYRSLEEFERDELRKLDDLLHASIDDMLDEMFAEDLQVEAAATKGRQRGQ